MLSRLTSSLSGWQQSGLTDPLPVRMATSAYRVDMDLIGGFISGCCDFTDTDTMT